MKRTTKTWLLVAAAALGGGMMLPSADAETSYPVDTGGSPAAEMALSALADAADLDGMDPVTVSVRDIAGNAVGQYHTSGARIVLDPDSGSHMVLTALHELAHHMDFTSWHLSDDYSFLRVLADTDAAVGWYNACNSGDEYGCYLIDTPEVVARAVTQYVAGPGVYGPEYASGQWTAADFAPVRDYLASVL